MKSLAAIGFLIMLFYQLIGLPLAVLTFEQSYESASPVSSNDQWRIIKLPISLPYTTSWENPDGREGLIQDGDEFYNVVHQQYANDTLYTLLKTNQNAKERFSELAEQLQQTDQEQTLQKSPLSRLLKLLKDRFTTYLLPSDCKLGQPTTLIALTQATYTGVSVPYCDYAASPVSPPPQK